MYPAGLQTGKTLRVNNDVQKGHTFLNKNMIKGEREALRNLCFNHIFTMQLF